MWGKNDIYHEHVWYPNTFHTQIGLGQKSKLGNNSSFRECCVKHMLIIKSQLFAHFVEQERYIWNKKEIFAKLLYYTNMILQIQYVIP